jgi:hypothetical protein
MCNRMQDFICCVFSVPDRQDWGWIATIQRQSRLEAVIAMRMVKKIDQDAMDGIDKAIRYFLICVSQTFHELVDRCKIVFLTTVEYFA